MRGILIICLFFYVLYSMLFILIHSSNSYFVKFSRYAMNNKCIINAFSKNEYLNILILII